MSWVCFQWRQKPDDNTNGTPSLPVRAQDGGTVFAMAAVTNPIHSNARTRGCWDAPRWCRCGGISSRSAARSGQKRNQTALSWVVRRSLWKLETAPPSAERMERRGAGGEAGAQTTMRTQSSLLSIEEAARHRVNPPGCQIQLIHTLQIDGELSAQSLTGSKTPVADFGDAVHSVSDSVLSCDTMFLIFKMLYNNIEKV